MTANSPVSHPITMAPQADVAPHSYVIQLEATRCLNCKTRKTHCRVFTKTNLRSRFETKYVTNLRPVYGQKDIIWNLPIETIMRPDEIIPFCEECFDQNPDLSHLRNPPPPPQQNLRNENEGKYKNFKPTVDETETKPKKSKTPLTPDDLAI